MSSISELIKQREALAAQQAALEQALKELQNAERQSAIDKVRALMAEHGLTVSDIASVEGRKTRGPNKAKGTDGRTGKTVAAKYRHPATQETWSGRGLKPKWLTAALEGGAKIEDFLIVAA
ncbi:H-NS family nucleoid-associated regulatory protein [Sphaerotilus mobilis]|uniref:DNA-binding protein H-NS n=1 Tax=Sphaerotilus mobilis TaxID=47994 RepID=A0A4Q7LQ70_9BURK|nr:H-NS histone family protein [Sphaerotilus mobilis]RZS56965.1 DNA-binding protein H-NS [Sphaerotilus mobilis]